MKKLLAGILLALTLVVGIGGGWLWRQSRMPPAWFQPPAAPGAADADMAEGIEYQVVETFHKLRPETDTWTVRIREEQINAWLAARLPDWIAHHEIDWPEDFGLPQARVGPAGIDLAVEVGAGEGRRVVVTRIAPRLVDGAIRLDVERVGVGRVALPGEAAGRVLDIIDRIAPGSVIDEDMAQRLVAVLTDGDGFGPAIELGDGRRVELVDVVLTDGAIALTNRTVPGGRTAPAGD